MESVNSLTVKELIELLQEFSDEQSGNEELPVVFAYNYGDHWHTEVLGEVNQVQEEVVNGHPIMKCLSCLMMQRFQFVY
jgi:hypothetical protein